jgi:ubiquinone/menaquinone biosynthesis C-methylase UbiE
MKLARLMHGSANPKSTDGITLGTPRLYEAMAQLVFMGRRRSTYQALVAAAGVKAGDVAVDVGCGTGFLTALMAAAVGNGGRAIGIDAAPEMVAFATHKARQRTNCHFQTGAAEALPLESGTVDAVVSSLMLHHLSPDSQVAFIAEARRVLRPGGRILVADVAHETSGFGANLLFRVTGLSHMRDHAPALEPLLAEGGFTELQGGRAGAWLAYATGHSYSA